MFVNIFGFQSDRLLRQVAIFSSLCLLTSACQLNTQDSGADSEPLKLSGPTQNCLSESLKSIESYFQGSSKPGDVDSAFTCVSGALELFKDFGRGSADRESFSSAELRSFIELNFLKEQKLTDAFLEEVMRVKIAILGGASDRLTKKELNRLIEVFDILRVEANRLRPYVDILNQRESTTPIDPSLLDQALSDFTYSMDTLGALLGQSKQPYKLENLQSLLNEFQGLYAGRSNWKGPQWFAQQMSLIAATKTLLIRADGRTIEPNEWQLLFSHIGRIYSLYLRFHYVMQGRDLFFGEGLNQIEIGVLELSGILEEAIAAKDKSVITYSVLTDFLLAVDSSGAFDLPIQASTIAGLLKPLLEQIFNPILVNTPGAQPLDPNDPLSIRAERREQGGLTKINLARMRDTLLSWVETQKFWEKLERDALAIDPNLAIGQPIPLKIIRPLWASYSPVYKESWMDLKSIFDRPIPPSTRQNGTLIFENSKTVTYDRDSFANLNWKQQIVRTIGYGYISDPEGLRMTGITLDQFEKVFADFQQLGLDLKFLDKSDTDIWRTGFSVSNIFLFSSNGDDRIGYHEAVDLFVVSFASGVIRDRIEDDVLKNCKLGPDDVAGVPTIESSCWRDRVKRGYDSFFADIPGWKNQMNDRSSGSWSSFFDNMEKASRKEENPSGPLASSERSRAISVHHYIESLFTRWDSNRNGQLALKEADKAYFLFKRLLKDASGFDDDAEVRALYFYLLAYGEPPNDSDLGDIIKWLWWKSNPDQWESRVKANRERLAQIFGNLASEL